VNLAFIDFLGYNTRVGSVGQVYPRSEDATLCAALVGLLAAPANLARMVRLETGYGRMWEQFDDGQVGSSAMPHKRNSVLSERINGLQFVAQGYLGMIGATSGAQWFEGDVSDSVTRRVGLPGLFKAVDAALCATIELLERLDLSKEAYSDELTDEWHSINTGNLLAQGLRLGMDRDKLYRRLQAGEVPEDLQEYTLQWYPSLPEAVAQIDRILEVIDVALGSSTF
jgi:adenylosuccinate lyase